MPGGITTWGSGQWLAAAHGLADQIAGYWVALALAEPGVDVDGDVLADLEPDPAAGYARTFFACSDTNFALDGEYLVSLVDLNCGVPTADWGIPTHYGLCNAQTSGELYAWGELSDTFYVETDFGVIIPAGGIAILLSTLDVSIAL